jgi:hypothetical protein
LGVFLDDPAIDAQALVVIHKAGVSAIFFRA